MTVTRYARALTSRCKNGLLKARIGVTAPSHDVNYRRRFARALTSYRAIMGHLIHTYRNILSDHYHNSYQLITAPCNRYNSPALGNRVLFLPLPAQMLGRKFLYTPARSRNCNVNRLIKFRLCKWRRRRHRPLMAVGIMRKDRANSARTALMKIKRPYSARVISYRPVRVFVREEKHRAHVKKEKGVWKTTFITLERRTQRESRGQ